MTGEGPCGLREQAHEGHVSRHHRQEWDVPLAAGARTRGCCTLPALAVGLLRAQGGV